MNAERLDQKQLNALFQEIFILSNDGSSQRKLYDSLKKTTALTFASLYVVKKKTRHEEVTIKADHNILLQLVVAYDAGEW